MDYSLNIALIEPEIPQNTGNIARTCAATGAKLHLVGPMGFTITDKQVKRAGLDYWDKLDITYYDSTEEFFEKNKGAESYQKLPGSSWWDPPRRSHPGWPSIAAPGLCPRSDRPADCR